MWKHILIFLIHYYDCRALLRTFNFVTHLILLTIVHLYLGSNLCCTGRNTTYILGIEIPSPNQVCDPEYNLGVESIQPSA